MPYEVLHFRSSEDIIRKKRMKNDVKATLDYIDSTLQGSLYRGELLRLALDEMDWRKDQLTIISGRRYQYKGVKRGIAIEGNFASYEYILEGLFRIQLGFDKGILQTGILLLTGQRSEKSKLGTSIDLAKVEVEELYPTISCPVSIAVFDLGPPLLPDEDDIKGGIQDGAPVLSQEKESETQEEDWGDSEPYP
jgi:hypothetical protein